MGAPDTIAEAAQIAHDLVMRRTDGDTALADLIRWGIHDAYRTGWNRALGNHPDKPLPDNHIKEN